MAGICRLDCLLCWGGSFLAPRSIGLYVGLRHSSCSAFFIVVFARERSRAGRWGEDDP